jgi:hypothetical protein
MRAVLQRLRPLLNPHSPNDAVNFGTACAIQI